MNLSRASNALDLEKRRNVAFEKLPYFEVRV